MDKTPSMAHTVYLKAQRIGGPPLRQHAQERVAVQRGAEAVALEDYEQGYWALEPDQKARCMRIAKAVLRAALPHLAADHRLALRDLGIEEGRDG